MSENTERVSTQKIVAERILNRLPTARLLLDETKDKENFEIYEEDILLLKIDTVGVHFMFPTASSKIMTWSSVLEGGPEQVADFVVRSLARAGFKVSTR